MEETKVTNKKSNGLSSVIIVLVIIMGLAYTCKNCGSPQTHVVEKEVIKKVDSQTVDVQPNWSDEQDTNKMTGNVNYFTRNTSTNQIDFKFPYDGGSTFCLTVRKENNSNDVLLQVSKGQFMGSDDRTIKVKFDNEHPEEYSYTGTSDGSSTTIFIGSAKKFINKLRNAKKLMIECEFYEEGNKIIEFDVSGFQWKH